MRTDAGRDGLGWSPATVLSHHCAPVAYEEAVLEEAAVSIVINGQPYAVMMVTPDHLDDFFYGFLWSEGLLQSLDEIIAWESVRVSAGWVIYLQLAPSAAQRIESKRRCVIGGSACGLCGTPCFTGLIPFEPLQHTAVTDAESVHDLLTQMQQQQALNRRTGTAHAAILKTHHGVVVREDIGRHNAVDKSIGAALQQQISVGDASILGVSSRLSFEIALKALGFGIPVVAAISGVSSLAIQLAESHGLTLIGYARDERMTVYAHAERVRDCAESIPPHF
jgi:FdhD protein